MTFFDYLLAICFGIWVILEIVCRIALWHISRQIVHLEKLIAEKT